MEESEANARGTLRLYNISVDSASSKGGDMPLRQRIR